MKVKGWEKVSTPINSTKLFKGLMILEKYGSHSVWTNRKWLTVMMGDVCPTKEEHDELISLGWRFKPSCWYLLDWDTTNQ